MHVAICGSKSNNAGAEWVLEIHDAVMGSLNYDNSQFWTCFLWGAGLGGGAARNKKPLILYYKI